MLAKVFGLNHQIPRGLPVFNPVGDSLYFHSFRNDMPMSHPGTAYLKTLWTPSTAKGDRKYGGFAPFHFFTVRGTTIGLK